MKVTISTIGLQNATGIAQKYTSKDIIFSGVLTMSGADGFIEIKASTGSEIVHLKKLPFTSDELGVESFDAFTVDAKKLHLVSKNTKSEQINIELNDGYIIVSSKRSKIKIDTLVEVENFNSVSCGKVLQIGDELIKSMAEVLPVIDTNNPKLELNGMSLEVNDGQMSLISTDTRRLAVSVINTSVENMSIIIPKEAINSILALFGGCSISAEFSETHIVINTDTLSYTSKLIAGLFPDWKRIVPKETKQEVSLDSALMVELIKEASMFNFDIIIDIKDNHITIVDDELNVEVTENIQAEGIDIVLAVNSKYLLDYIGTGVGESFTLGVNDSNLPVVLTSDSNYKQVVMPITNHRYTRLEKEAA